MPTRTRIRCPHALTGHRSLSAGGRTHSSTLSDTIPLLPVAIRVAEKFGVENSLPKASGQDHDLLAATPAPRHHPARTAGFMRRVSGEWTDEIPHSGCHLPLEGSHEQIRFRVGIPSTCSGVSGLPQHFIVILGNKFRVG